MAAADLIVKVAPHEAIAASNGNRLVPHRTAFNRTDGIVQRNRRVLAVDYNDYQGKQSKV